MPLCLLCGQSFADNAKHRCPDGTITAQEAIQQAVDRVADAKRRHEEEERLSHPEPWKLN